MCYRLFLLIALAGNVFAEDIPGFAPDNDPAANGLAIAEEAARRDDGFNDSAAQMTMTLYNGRGDSVVRRMQSKTLEMPADGDRTILYFEDPADVAGTAFLTHSHPDRANDQWLYLPALKRTKRIAANRRSGAFMSSEFSYEDLGNDEVSKYDYQLLGEEAIDGVDSYHLQRIPTGNSGYSKQEVWLHKEALYLLKADYYDRSGALLKTLAAGPYEQFRGRFWRPLEMQMINHQNGRKTVLGWSDYRFDNGLPESDFERSALGNIR